MNGPELLEHAAGLINRRRREYGEPVDLFEQVAQRWSLTLSGRKGSSLGGPIRKSSVKS